MDPRHLIQLAAILEKGSITQASNYLHLTQPTLTHNMQTLEMQAGGKLFERSRLGVRSTPMGEMLAREGRAIARRLKDAAEVSARHRSGIKNQVRLGTGPLIGAALLPGLMQQLLLGHPEIALTVQSDRPHLLLDQLVDGRHDLVIAPSWLERPPPGIERILLVKDVLTVVCGPQHALAEGGVLKPGDAEALNWISLGTTSPFDKDIQDMLRSAGLRNVRTQISLSGETFMFLRTLSQGKHLAVLPRLPVRLLNQYLPLVELTIQAPAQPRNIYLWCKATLLEDPVFAAMKKTIVAYTTELEHEQSTGPLDAWKARA